MPRFIAPQLCTLVERPPASAGLGARDQVRRLSPAIARRGRRGVLSTRSGLDWTEKFPEIARAAQKLPDCIIDGEIVALDSRRVPSFADLQAALSERNTAQLTFFGFDLLYLKGEDLRELPLFQRKQRLAALLERQGSRDHPLSWSTSKPRPRPC